MDGRRLIETAILVETKLAKWGAIALLFTVAALQTENLTVQAFIAATFGVIVAASFIRALVRWCNRHADAHHAKVHCDDH